MSVKLVSHTEGGKQAGDVPELGTEEDSRA